MTLPMMGGLTKARWSVTCNIQAEAPETTANGQDRTQNILNHVNK